MCALTPPQYAATYSFVNLRLAGIVFVVFRCCHLHSGALVAVELFNRNKLRVARRSLLALFAVWVSCGRSARPSAREGSVIGGHAHARCDLITTELPLDSD